MSPDAFDLRDVLATLLALRNHTAFETEAGRAGLLLYAKRWAAAFNERHPDAALLIEEGSGG